MQNESECDFSIDFFHDIPAITACATEAFTTFDVFGPPWWSDAGVLPSILLGSNLQKPFSRGALDREGRLVGHALWNLGTIHLAGKNRPAAWLAPLSVVPDWQNRGLGGAMMRDGIELLGKNGYEILLILGHDAYYPRFGLLTSCMGRRGIRVSLPPALSADPEGSQGWKLRPMRVEDGPACLALWRNLVGDVDGAIDPGPGFLPWASKTKDIAAIALERSGALVGHARIDLRPEADAEGSVLRFLAADAAAAGMLLARIAGWKGWTGNSCFLPLPDSPTLPSLGFKDLEIVAEAWKGGMAMALPGAPVEVDAALREVHEGKAAPLFVEWSPLFDF